MGNIGSFVMRTLPLCGTNFKTHALLDHLFGSETLTPSGNF
jgi:hypothetical protein